MGRSIFASHLIIRIHDSEKQKKEEKKTLIEQAAALIRLPRQLHFATFLKPAITIWNTIIYLRTVNNDFMHGYNHSLAQRKQWMKRDFMHGHCHEELQTAMLKYQIYKPN